MAQKKKDDAYFKFEELILFQTEYKSIRDKYDPNRQWCEYTNVPKEYFIEMDKLTHEHREMIDILKRRGQWIGGYYLDF